MCLLCVLYDWGTLKCKIIFESTTSFVDKLLFVSVH